MNRKNCRFYGRDLDYHLEKIAKILGYDMDSDLSFFDKIRNEKRERELLLDAAEIKGLEDKSSYLKSMAGHGIPAAILGGLIGSLVGLPGAAAGVAGGAIGGSLLGLGRKMDDDEQIDDARNILANRTNAKMLDRFMYKYRDRAERRRMYENAQNQNWHKTMLETVFGR